MGLSCKISLKPIHWSMGTFNDPCHPPHPPFQGLLGGQEIDDTSDMLCTCSKTPVVSSQPGVGSVGSHGWPWLTGWLGTFVIFPYIGNHNPNWLNWLYNIFQYFSEGLKPPTSHLHVQDGLNFVGWILPNLDGPQLALRERHQTWEFLWRDHEAYSIHCHL